VGEMAPTGEGAPEAALNFVKSMLKLDSRERGGKGEEVFRFLAWASVCFDGSTTSSVVLLLAFVRVSFPLGLLSCWAGSVDTGAETCRLPPGFVDSDPRLGRRMLPDRIIQLPGDEKVIEMERFARFEGVSSGVEFEESVDRPFESSATSGCSSSAQSGPRFCVGIDEMAPGCVR